LENLKEDTGIDGKCIGMDRRERGWKGVDWMQLAQDWDQWWALLNMVVNLQVP